MASPRWTTRPEGQRAWLLRALLLAVALGVSACDCEEWPEFCNPCEDPNPPPACEQPDCLENPRDPQCDGS